MKRQLNLRFLIIFTAVCLGLGVSAYFAHAMQTRRHADYLAKRGYEAEEQGNLDEAADYFVKYLAYRPDDGKARGRFGLIRAGNAKTYKQKEGAFLVLERALRDDPNMADVRRKSIELAMELDRFTDARANLDILLAATPNDPELLELLGQCDEQGGRIPEAIKNYEQVITVAPQKVETYNRLAALYSRTNQKEQADAVMKKLLENNRDSLRARLIRFEYFRGIGDLETARTDLKFAQDAANPGENEDAILLASADLAIADRKFDDARQILNRGRNLQKKNLKFSLALANLEVKLGNRTAAVKVLEEAKKIPTENPAETWAIADLLIDADEPTQAEQLLVGLEGKIEQAALNYLQGRLKYKRGELSTAVRILEKCRVDFVRSPDLGLQTELLLADCYARLEQNDQRLDACRKALQIDRGSIAARQALASTHLAMNNIDEGIREYQVLRSLQPSVRLTIARIRMWQSRNQPEAREQYLLAASVELEGAPEQLKETADYKLAQVELLIANGKVADARKILEAARDKNPEEVVFWQVLANIAAAEGKPADGLAILKAASEKLGDRVEIKLSRIGLMLRDNSKPEAFRAMEEGVDQLPEADRDRLLVGLAQAYSQVQAPADAERLYRKLAEHRPNDLGVLTRLFDIVLTKANAEEIGQIADKIRRVEGEEGVVWRFAEACHNWLIHRKDKSPASLLIAQNLLEECAKRRPGWFRVPLLEGEIEDANGRIEAAIEKYQAAIRLGARYPELVQRVVQLLMSRRRFDEAREQINAIRSQSNALPDELGKAATEISVLQRDSAEKTLQMAEKTVSADSKDYRDQLWRGQVYYSLDRKEQAEKAFRKALELDATVPETWIAVVTFLARTDRMDEAQATIEKAKSLLPQEKRAKVLAPCFEAVGNKAEAEKFYITLVTESPNDTGALRSQASFYMSVGEVDKAAPIYRRLVELFPTDSDQRRWARRSLAMSLVATGDYIKGAESLSLIDANLREKPGNPEDLLNRAIVQALRPGGRQQSIKDLEESFAKLLPTATQEFLLARLYEADGNWLKAKERFEKLLTNTGSRNPGFYAHYIRVLLKRDEVQTAAAWYQRLESLARTIDKSLDKPEKSPLLVELMARLWVKQGKKSEAATLLKTFAKNWYQDMKMTEKNPNVYRDIGRLLAELKLTSDAEEMLRQYVSLAQAKSPEAVFILAEFLARDDRVGEAIKLCAGVLKAAGPETSALIAISAVRLGKATPQDYTAAETVINQAIQLMPKSLDLQVSLAEFRDAQGKYDEAKSRYRAILALDPRNQVALNNLAWLLAFEDGKAAEALMLIDTAIKNAGEQPNFLDTRGVILMNLGRFDEAIEQLSQAATQSRTPEVYFHLAQAQQRAGQTLETQRTFRKAKEAGFTQKYLHPLEMKGYQEFVKVVGDPD